MRHELRDVIDNSHKLSLTVPDDVRHGGDAGP